MRWLAGILLSIEVSALLVEFNDLITVKSHYNILTDAWHFPHHFIVAGDLRDLGQISQYLALAHVLHPVL